ncbi:DUF2169 domain-containing protein [Ciceribacter sp. L1K22]|uniref:DUF2169 family type VI secretion system accessory protein n=1 Tax=Ciceribacter sp. L1K22 TaxID=2820275 RepID=UPI001ABDD80C|nr:DUF2169 domain-containing protein [Ciceribacter sp. L1K22]MBO3761697.1 DUF2169 domain-containing protein [Ciceribacter sp. L1K22]
MPAIIKPSRLAAAVRAEPAPHGGLLTVSAFLLSDFERPRDFLSEQALWPMTVEQMNGGIFDKGYLKPRGEWIVAGAAMAPGEEAVRGITVIARLGGLEKRLSVFGDRYWRQTERGIELIPAVPFHKMPIVEGNAFGGPRFAANPRGKGHGARALLDAGLDAPLPNVEDAARPVRSPDDAPNPAHLGPLAPDAASRMRYVGTYDEAWLKTLAPLRPADFNPLFHCDAPEEQRISGYFSGNETFSISGMTRGGIAGGQLPAVTVRGFAHRPVDGSLTEFRLVCDTVTLFPNITKMALAFRGVVKCVDAFAEDIGSIMLAVEHIEDQARPSAYFGEIFGLRTDPAQAHKHALSDFQLMPKRDEAVVGLRRAQRLEKAKADRERFMDNQEWMARKLMSEQGMSPDLVPPSDRTMFTELPLVAMPTSEDIANGDLDLAEVLDDVERLSDALMETGRKEMARAELVRRTMAAKAPAGKTRSALEKPVVNDEELSHYPELADELAEQYDVDISWPDAAAFANADLSEFPEDAIDSLNATLDDMFATLDEASGFNEAEADAQYEKALARALGLPEGSLFADARATAANISFDFEPDADLFDDDEPVVRQIGERMAAIAQMPHKPVPGSPASGFSLPVDDDFPVDTAPITAAETAMVPVLERILPNLKSIKAGGSSRDIMAELAAAMPVEGDKPALTIGEHLREAKQQVENRLDEAETSLDAAMRDARQESPVAIFPMEIFLPGVAERFGATLRQRGAEGHDFRGADLAGADLNGIDLSGRDLSGTLFERCDLRNANFSDCDLDGAVFAEADLTGADFTSARLGKANFGGAVLAGARFDRCVFEDGKFIRVKFDGMSWRQGRMARVVFIECSLDGADFSGSTLSEVQLLKGTAARLTVDDGILDRVTLVQIPLVGASFANASFDRVGLTEIEASKAVFRGARFKSTGFFGATSLSDSNFEAITARDTSWNTADLARACLLRADMDSCLFNACDLSSADMRLVTLKNSRLDKSVLIGADLFAANLYGASLSYCDMTRASLRGANLYYAALDRAELASCDLTGANVGGTRMGRVANA